MSPAVTSPETLRRQIGWLCQTIRFAAVIYAGWTLFQIVTLWLDKEKVMRAYGNWLKVDLSGITDGQRAAGFLVHATIAALVVATIYAVWQLFSGFLAGRVFTLDATLWLRRIGIFGLAAEMADIFSRPLVTGIVSMHREAGSRMVSVALNPNDLVFLMFLLSLIALGHIHKKAAELAEENAGMV